MLFAAKKVHERRRDERIDLACSITLTIDDHTHHCQMRNLSESGVFAELSEHTYDTHSCIAPPNNSTQPIKVSDEGLIEFYSQGREFKARCTIVRIFGNTLGLAFFGLKDSQLATVREIIDRASAANYINQKHISSR